MAPAAAAAISSTAIGPAQMVRMARTASMGTAAAAAGRRGIRSVLLISIALETVVAVAAEADVAAPKAIVEALEGAHLACFCSTQPASRSRIMTFMPVTAALADEAATAAAEVRGAAARSAAILIILYKKIAMAAAAATVAAAATAGTAAAVRAAIRLVSIWRIPTPAPRSPAAIRSPSANPARAETRRETRGILASPSNSERHGPIWFDSEIRYIFATH